MDEQKELDLRKDLRKELDRSVTAWAEGRKAPINAELVTLGLMQPDGDPSAAALLVALGYDGYVSPAVTKFFSLTQESSAADAAVQAAEERCLRASNALAHAATPDNMHEAQTAGWALNQARMRRDAALAKCNRARNAVRAEVRKERMLRLIQVAKDALSEVKNIDGAAAYVVDRGQEALMELESSIRGSQ